MQQPLVLRQVAPPRLHGAPPSSNPHEAGVSGDAAIRFGRFCVLPRARQLLVDGQPIELGGRAFDLLMVLIGAPGILITKQEIISRVWPDTVVDESNLKVQMSVLRRVLNADRDVIKTVHGRGYVFTGEVSAASIESDTASRFDSEPTPLVPPGLSDRNSPPRQSPSRSPMSKLDDQPQPVVAIIDDDPEIRDALRGLLRATGLRVESFASVREFLDNIPSDLPGCLVLDVELPGQSGLEFQEELAKANLHLPIIFISGHADVPMSVRAMKRGAIEFLTKPVGDQDLLDAIQLAIARDCVPGDAGQAVAGRARLVRHADAA